MANNVTTTTTVSTVPSGTVIATDDVAGVVYQKIKIADGADDSAAMIGGDAANGLDVDVTRVGGNVTVVQGTAASLNCTASLAAGTNIIGAILDNQSVSLNQLGGVAASVGNGASGTGVLRVTVANDSTGQVALAAGTAAIGKLAANSGVDIGDVDITSVIPGTGATNLGKPDDSGRTLGDTGVAALAVRRDADTSLVSATNDYSPLLLDASGYLKVNVKAGSASSTQYATNAAYADGNTGTLALTVRDDALSTLTEADGDYSVHRVDSTGALWVTPASAFEVIGHVDHDTADSSNPPVKVGAVAKTALSGLTLVSAGDMTQLHAGVDGVLIIRTDCNLEDIVTATPIAITDGSSTSIIAAQGAGIKFYLKEITIANTSATAVTVDLRDGAAGSVKWTFPVPANTSGIVKTFSVPLGFSANTAMCADPSAAASTITVSALGFKSKV